MRYFELNAKPVSRGFRPAHALRQMIKTGQSKRYARSHYEVLVTDFSSMQDIGHTPFRGAPGPSTRVELVNSPWFRGQVSRRLVGTNQAAFDVCTASDMELRTVEPDAMQDRCELSGDRNYGIHHARALGNL